jgi:hypothetical protein
VILAAGLLVLTGLGLFLAGVLTGTTAFYWACVVVCVGAAVLLFAARRRISRAEAALPADAAASRTRTTNHASAPASSLPPVSPPGPAEGGRPAATDADAPAYREEVFREPVPASAHAASVSPSSSDMARVDRHDPPIEDVEVTDLLLVVDLKDDVLVVDEHPRYHLASCLFLVGRTAIPLPLDEARTDGFTPCALCAPDRHLADRERARKHRA